jgi:hypothetical protein
MGWSVDRVCIWWTGTASSILGPIELDGEKNARYDLSHVSWDSGWEYEVHDVESDVCPIIVDLDAWRADLIKGSNKFNARNALFEMRG